MARNSGQPRGREGTSQPARSAPEEESKLASADDPTASLPTPEEQRALIATRVSSGGPEAAGRHEEDTAIVSSSQPGLTTLGDFELIRKIGEGAMGAVYLARQISFEREVALKVLFPHVANNPKLVERLRREGLTLGKLDHPSIVQAVGYFAEQGFHYIAMEYVAGDSLQKWLGRLGKLEVPDALHVTLVVARALEYAHGLGLVHRDIKPDNVLINKQGDIKVGDFGMVKTAEEDLSLTQTGHAVGTPWYMPLEQARNAKETDGRCDIYALGCMLYCMLTGNPPFIGRTIVDVIQSKEAGTFSPARAANPEVPERLDLIIAKMAAKLPRYRYQTCAELIRDLESLNLASDEPSFVTGRKPPKPAAATPTPAEQTAAVDVDPDLWYVQIIHGNGSSTLAKYNTAEVKRMLSDGSVRPTARASHQRREGFRALATYKEFQGEALSKVSKEAADQQGAQFRQLMKKIEENDRQREEKEKAQERKVPLAEYWHSLWLPSLCVAGGILVIFLIWYIANGLGK